MTSINVYVRKTLFLSLINLFFISGFLHAQESKEPALRNMINNKDFVFKAQSVLPLSGPVRQLTSDYDLKVSPNALVSYLPYFGRAYVAPINPEEGAMNFTSKKFDYKVKEREKGGWDITILPLDQKDVRQLILRITKDGYASLDITSNNRQNISYNGYVTEPEHR